MDDYESGTIRDTMNILQSLRKTICSGKQGEAALKFHSDGSVLATVDTINDIIKIVEDAINSVGNEHNKFGIGLNFMADQLYVEA